jgi:hypothetical protein
LIHIFTDTQLSGRGRTRFTTGAPNLVNANAIKRVTGLARGAAQSGKRLALFPRLKNAVRALWLTDRFAAALNTHGSGAALIADARFAILSPPLNSAVSAESGIGNAVALLAYLYGEGPAVFIDLTVLPWLDDAITAESQWGELALADIITHPIRISSGAAYTSRRIAGLSLPPIDFAVSAVGGYRLAATRPRRIRQADSFRRARTVTYGDLALLAGNHLRLADARITRRILCADRSFRRALTVTYGDLAFLAENHLRLAATRTRQITRRADQTGRAVTATDRERTVIADRLVDRMVGGNEVRHDFFADADAVRTVGIANTAATVAFAEPCSRERDANPHRMSIVRRRRKTIDATPDPQGRLIVRRTSRYT